MLAYLIRRLLLMIPTLVGILIINFAVLRLQGPTLKEDMLAQASQGGERKVSEGAANVEDYLGRFRRRGLDLPAVINWNGFVSKNSMVKRLQAAERSGGHKESDAAEEEASLWLFGHFGVEPLAEVLADDTLERFHGPASMALTLCAYGTLNPEDASQLSAERIDHIRQRNLQLKTLRIGYTNSAGAGYQTTDPHAQDKRQRLLALIKEDRNEFAHSTGRASAALFFETGFTDFMGKLLTGRLYSDSRKEYVFTLIADRWYVTCWLTLLSTAIAWAISIPLGIRSARKAGTLEDRATTNTLFLLWSLPSFFVGTLMLHHLCTNGPDGHALFPNRGVPDADAIWLSGPRYVLDVLWHGALPLALLCYNSFTSLSRYMRGNVLDNLQSDYVRTARAKGCDEDRVIYGHVVRNSMVTMITLAAGLLADLFGGFVIVENVFSIPGLGTLLLDAARQNDAPLVMGSTIISVMLLLVGILISDLLYGLVDPRIRSRYA